MRRKTTDRRDICQFLDTLEPRRLLAADVAFDLSPTGMSARNFVRLGDQVLFVGSKPETGQELYRTDGTPEGTVVHAQVFPGAWGGDFKNFASTGTRVFFVGDNLGREVGGLNLVGLRQTGPSGGDSIVQPLESFDSTNYRGYGLAGSTYVYAFWDGTKEVLYANSGTANNTPLIADGFGAGSTLNYFTSVGNRLYFTELRADETYQLWSTDGTSSGLTQHTNAPLRRVFTMYEEGGELYVDGIRTNETRRSLFAYSPTEGMERIARATRPEPIGVVNNRLVFFFRNTTVGVVLRTDETAALPGTTDVRLDGAAVLGNTIYYTNGAGQLWTSDGTSAGSSLRHTFTDPQRLSTQVVVGGGRAYVLVNYKDGRSSELFLVSNDPTNPTLLGAFNTPRFFDAGNYLLVQAPNGDGSWIMYAARDTTPTTIDGSFTSGGSSNPTVLGVLNNQLVLSSNIVTRDNSAQPDTVRLFMTDGDEQADSFAVISGLYRTIGEKSATVNDTLLFRLQRTTRDGRDREELWRTDGTRAGTYQISAFGPARGLRLMATLGNRHVFAVSKSGDPSGTFSEVWITDGTNRRTLRAETSANVSAVSPGRYTGAVVMRGKIYFSIGGKLYSSLGGADNTIEETSLFTTVGNTPTGIDDIAASSDRLWLLARPGSSTTRKIFVSDGTSAGSRVVEPPPADISSTRLVAAGSSGLLVYGVANASGNLSVYRLTPTASAFTGVGGFFTNAESILDFSVAGNAAYFNVINSGATTSSLWYFTGAALTIITGDGTNQLIATPESRLTTIGLTTYMNAGNNRQDFWRFTANVGRRIDSKAEGPNLEANPDIAELRSSIFFTGNTRAGREVRSSLISSRITGRLYIDANDNDILDNNEQGVAGMTIFVDRNNNGRLDANEVSSVTDNEGRYALENISRLGDQDNNFRLVVLPSGRFRLQEDGISVVFTENPQALNFNYRVIATPTVVGSVWIDTNGNGRRSGDEPGLPDRRIFADLNNDGVFDSNEPSVLTDSNGNYELFNLPQGRTTIRLVPVSGETYTTPTSFAVTLNNGQSTARSFGISA